jgi:hypothetical protein
MHFDPQHPSNRKVLEYLCRDPDGWTGPLLEPAASNSALKPRPGSHPEIVEHLWETLAARLPVECRALVCGSPALVAPTRGVIFGVPLGTEYALRLRPAEFAMAKAAGAEVLHRYRTVVVTLDLSETLGPHWIFGRFDPRELEWCVAALEFADAS